MPVTRENYFDPAVCREYMSSHRFASWLECPARQWHNERGATPELFRRYEEDKACFRIGHYIEIGLLEPHLLPAWIEGNAEYVFKASGKAKGEKYAEYAAADEAIELALKKDLVCQLLESGTAQVPMVGDIDGVPWKILVDWHNPMAGLFMDVKTSRSFEAEYDPSYGVRVPWYHRYWRQMAVYRHVINQNMKAEDEWDDAAAYLCGIRKPTQTMPPMVEIVAGLALDLDAELAQVRADQPAVMDYVASETEPRACGRCWWCALTQPARVVTAVRYARRALATE
jgi:hypothetical protein